MARAGTENVIYNFGGPSVDGSYPFDTLLWDKKGNLLGTTSQGGAADSGAVFQISPPHGGGTAWSETGFFGLPQAVQAGHVPIGGLVFDTKQKNVFGTTRDLGPRKAGTVFKLGRKLARSGVATFGPLTLLHTFVADDGDGAAPYAGVVFGPKGGLYGTAETFGGTCPGCVGVVYELVPPAWQEKILYTFSGGGDGALPRGGVVFDAAGNLYGTTTQGGNNNACTPIFTGCGTVYRLSPHKNGWLFTTLYTFQGSPDGAFPNAALILDAAGNLYGTTAYGGVVNCQFGCGTVFKLSPPSGGGAPWNETTLYSFTGVGDGGNPEGNPVFDAAGNLYVTASAALNGTCVDDCGGTVMEFSPSGGLGGWTPTILHTFAGAPDGADPEGGLVLDGAGHLYGTTRSGGSNDFGTVFEVTP
jgi:uncharacterized repeat protein (TIGR03803 family)